MVSFFPLSLNFLQNSLKLLLKLEVCLPKGQLQVASSLARLASCQQTLPAATGWEFLFALALQGGFQWQRIWQQQNLDA